MADGHQMSLATASGFGEHAVARPVSLLLLGDEQPGPYAPSRVLGSHRYVTYGARQPAEAQRLVSQNDDIGIVILDLQGDGFRGIEVYAGLCQRLSRDRELAAIFLARSPSVNDAVRALRLGAVDLLRSPVSPTHLLDAVARAESLLARRAILRDGARAMGALVAELQRQTTSQIDAARHIVSLGPADSTAVEFTETLEANPHQEDTASLAHTRRQRRRVAAAIKAHLLRRDLLGPDLVGDPCWEMLLDLHENALMGRPVSVSSLCSVVALPATTALRRLGDMVAAGLVTRIRDSNDARRVLIGLSETGTSRLMAYFDAVGTAG